MSITSRLGPAFTGGLVGAVIASGTLVAAGILDDDDSPDGAEPGIGLIASPSAGAAGAVTAAQAVYERVGAGVVSIQARGGGAEARLPLPGDDEEEDEDVPRPDTDPDDPSISTGSGFVIDSDGTVITNAHVVGESKDVTVGFTEDGDGVEAEVIGSDASTDIAVLKVDPKDAPKLTVLRLADSDGVQVGEPAIAIGNPFGLNRTATAGIISGKGREIQSPNGFQIDGILQTDAPINPGNSGGPLLDTRGRVIGVNSQILTGGQGRGNVGIGFAVPSKTVQDIVPRLQRDGKIARAYLGVSTLELTKEIAEELDVKERAGALIVTIARGGPAEKAGLKGARANGKGGDIITAIDGKRIPDPEAVAAAVNAKSPGDRIRVTVKRGTASRTITVTLGDRPRSAVR